VSPFLLVVAVVPNIGTCSSIGKAFDSVDHLMIEDDFLAPEAPTF